MAGPRRKQPASEPTAGTDGPRPVTNATGAPLATLACDPSVEAEILDQAVTSVFLRHMSLGAEPVAWREDPPARRSKDAPIRADELRALAAATTEIECAPAPPLDERLGEERLWILADISMRGGGVARQRATAELRGAMRDLAAWRGVDATVLGELVGLLAEAMGRPDMPLLFRTLHAAAERALRAAEQAEDR